jgi:phage repressor protein C with HTH and peptisase S24 domain
MNSLITQRFIICHDKLVQDDFVKSSRQFAIQLDYLPQSLSEILKNRRDVTIELIRKAVEVYKINPVYLFTGEGDMFLKENIAPKGLQILTVVTDQHQDEKIVHVPTPALSAYATDFKNPEFLKNLPSYTLPDYKYKVGTHRSFDVSGDSMEPTLFEGDKVICSFLEPSLWESAIKDNYVYVFVTKSDVIVRRVKNKTSEKTSFLLVSDNTFYDSFEISWPEINEIWYVRAKLSPFLPAPSNLKNLLRNEIDELKKTIQNQSKINENLYKTIETLLSSNK